MRVLLDENMPVELASHLSDDEVVHVKDVGWTGISNGELLRRAVEGGLRRTTDRRHPHASTAESRCL